MVINLKNAAARDYEDLALAPGEKPGTYDVCVADVGDNPEKRAFVTIYRFPEVGLPPRDGQPVTVEVRAYHLSYPDGPADVEAFCVHPRTGDGYILTKGRNGRSIVYKLPAPWQPDTRTELTKLTEVELPAAQSLARIITAADIAPDGQRLAVRCYIDGWEWRLPLDAGDDSFDTIFKYPPVRLSLVPETQGEALCYSADGRALLTLSEGVAPVLYEHVTSSDAARP
ncbi:MAG: hypothetical protein ABIG44_04675 [Planctomycetota bacterium]